MSDITGEARHFELGQRVRTTQDWADRFNVGHVVTGQIHRIVPRGWPTSPLRTHTVLLDQPVWGDHSYVRFDPADLEPEPVAPSQPADPFSTPAPRAPRQCGPCREGRHDMCDMDEGNAGAVDALDFVDFGCRCPVPHEDPADILPPLPPNDPDGRDGDPESTELAARLWPDVSEPAPVMDVTLADLLARVDRLETRLEGVIENHHLWDGS